jgi:hypothetical protein
MSFAVTPPGSPAGCLNVHFRGPFTYLYYANPNRKEVLIICPRPKNHHLPYVSSELSEAPVGEHDYSLQGVKPTQKSYPEWASKNVNRLMVPASKLKMDTGGIIDPGRAKRFFSVVVPSPDWILPWHPVEITITGGHSPSAGAKLFYPVGLTFVYEQQATADVSLVCPTDSNYPWKAQLNPSPAGNSSDILLEMDSSLDVDCQHANAIHSFAAECDLYKGVNPGASLDLGLNYGDPMPNCATLREAIAGWQRSGNGMIPAIAHNSLGHTGTDCKAAILEINGVADSVTLDKPTRRKS